MDLIDLIQRLEYTDKNIPAIEIHSYLKHLSKPVFYEKNINKEFSDKFTPITGKEFLTIQYSIASALLDYGVEKGSIVGIFSKNNLYYAATVFATMSLGAVVMPIYPTILQDELEDILRDSGCRILCVGDVAQFQKGFAILNKIQSPLRMLITYFDSRTKHDHLITIDDLLQFGKTKANYEKINTIIPTINLDDNAALIYTPGTTGEPRGALLTHGNFISQKVVVPMFNFTDKDIRLAHLPFSHVYGFSADLLTSAFTGATMAISSTFESEEIYRNMIEMKPTVIATVPRMYEKLYISTIHTVRRFNPIKKFIYITAIHVGRECHMAHSLGNAIPKGAEIINKILSPIKRSIRKLMHMQQVRLLFSGGAPLPLDVAYFFGGIGLPIIEGYGLTETSPVVTINRIEKNKPGTVGCPIPGAEIKISDEGEILIKGSMVFNGYYKMTQEEKEEIFTPDGYFRSGDIGIIDEEGYLRITGRLKDIIITSQGKNIVPLNIEKKFESEPLINYICVVGDRRKYVSALIVPNFHLLRQYAREHGIPYKTDEELVSHPQVQSLYKIRINEICQALPPYEQIKKFTLLPHDFSVKSGELTPTFKFRRSQIHEKYKDIIDLMYPKSDITRL
ncbi:MAG: AMP-dependent synthetase/ligase [Spirochaetota bacterium]